MKETENEVKLFDKKAFETTINGKPVSLYTIKSGNGIVMQVTNYGAHIVSLWTPDREGKYEDVVLGYDNIQQYIAAEERYVGSIVGRYANRIAGGKFDLDGTSYELPINNGPNCLHGGPNGFDAKVWVVEKLTDNEIRMSYTSKDGAEGFPGKLSVVVKYILTPENELLIKYKAKTDKPTHVNLTNHSYFNLKGMGNGTAMDHLLMINADKYLPINDVCIPLGEPQPVEGTPFDFRTERVIGERIDEDNEQIRNGAGYDHCYVFPAHAPEEVVLAATVYEPTSGRVLEVLTDQPGMQFYSSNWFGNKAVGKYGKTLNKRESFALETQKFPNSPNRPDYPSTRLDPGDIYTQICIYKFSTK